MKTKLTSLLLLVIIIISLCSCTSETEISKLNTKPSGDLNVHFLDVGQGDCALLESDGHFVLIDAGEKDYAYTVCKYLKDNNVKTIDYVIASHPHSDHCGALSDVIETFECKNFITTETTQHTTTWLNVLSAVDKYDVNYIDAKVADTYSFGQSTFEILAPVKSDYQDNYNNHSVVIKATCGDTSFLFTGDIEKLAENDILKNNCDLKADVLKVSHHGSSTSSSSDFLDAVDPSCAIISCGKQNDYGHPHKQTLQAFKSRNITVFRTDELSTIIASSNKKEIKFYYQNTTQAVPHSNNQNTSTVTYIGNKNSKKFHLSTCDGVKNMSENNKVDFTSRQQAIDSGYTACKTCNP